MKGFSKLDILSSRDPRGWVSNLPDFRPDLPEGLNYVHIVSMEPGAIRGNHYHREQIETLCILGTKIQVKAVNRETAETYKEIVNDDPPTMFVISPKISHAFRNLSEQVGYLVCFTDRNFDPDNPDVVTDIIIKKEPTNAP